MKYIEFRPQIRRFSQHNSVLKYYFLFVIGKYEEIAHIICLFSNRHECYTTYENFCYYYIMCIVMFFYNQV